MFNIKFLRLHVFLLVFLISSFSVPAEETPENYYLNLFYDGKNLSFGNVSREAVFGIYNVEVLSLGGVVIEKSEFVLMDNLSQTFKVIVPYSEEGMLLNIYYPNKTLMFYTDISVYAGEEYQNISGEEKEIKIQNIVSSRMNETYTKELEEKQKTTEKWFTVLIVATIIIVGIPVLYVWIFKKPRKKQ